MSKSFSDLNAKLDFACKGIMDAAINGTKDAVSIIEDDAKFLAPVSNGELREGTNSAVQVTQKQIVGEVGSSAPHAAYVEFGTGLKGREHIDILPEEIRSKVQHSAEGWWIHESQIDAASAEKYCFYKSGEFYYTSGQAPQPYLYPALDQNKKEAINIIADEINKAIKEFGG